jgi:hypothetical protein
LVSGFPGYKKREHLFKGNYMTSAVFNPLDQAEKAIAAKPTDYPALAEASAQLAALVPDNRYLAAPLLVIGQKLAERENYLLPAIEAVMVTAVYALASSEVKREAEAIWLKYVDGLPEAVQRIEAA